MTPLDAVRLLQRAYAVAPDRAIGPTLRWCWHQDQDGWTMAIPGTRPAHVADDLADLDIGPLEVLPGRMAHRGFWECAALALTEAAAKACSGELRCLVGHSLGAAIAVDIATQLAMIGLQVAEVIGFGCPHTSVGSWQRDLLAEAGTVVTLYRNGGDIVPRLPAASHAILDLDPSRLTLTLAHWLLPGLGDWQHGGAEIQIGDADHILNAADHALALYGDSLGETVPA